MDNGRGRFAEISNEVVEQVRNASGGRDKVPIFEVGETIAVRGSSFQVRNLDAFTGIVTLKLLPRIPGESLKNRNEERPTE